MATFQLLIQLSLDFEPVLDYAYNPYFQFTWLGFVKKHSRNHLSSFFSLRQTDEREAFD